VPASPADGDRYAHHVARLLDDLEAALLRLVAQLLAKDTKTESRVWQAERLAELQWLKQKAQRATAAEMPGIEQAIRDAVLQAYNHGTATAVTDLDATGREFRPGGLPAAETALSLASQPIEQTRRAAAMIPQILGAAYRDAVAAGAADVLSGGSTRLAASQRVLDRLLADGIRGFTDTAGRRWSLDTYVEMAVRTTTGQAAVAGHVAQLGAVGVDLVVVSDSPRECPLCRPWEGKVLSLSGQVGAVILPAITGGDPVTVKVAGTLAQAKAAGFQHPNCTHRVTAYLPGATKLDPPKSDPAGYVDKQRQRALERKVREWKRREHLALTDEARAGARVKVRAWQKALREHVDANDLKRLPYRERVGNSTTALAR
jgi:hypothetical protein